MRCGLEVVEGRNDPDYVFMRNTYNTSPDSTLVRSTNLQRFTPTCKDFFATGCVTFGLTPNWFPDLIMTLEWGYELLGCEARVDEYKRCVYMSGSFFIIEPEFVWLRWGNGELFSSYPSLSMAGYISPTIITDTIDGMTNFRVRRPTEVTFGLFKFVFSSLW